MLTKLTHLSLFVDNQENAKDFFTHKLGFAVHTDATFGTMRWLTLCLPDQRDFELCLMQANTEQEKQLVGKQGAGIPLCAIETTDCRADYKKLKDLGVLFIDEPKEEAWGIGVSFKDIVGNIWYLNQSK